MRQRHRARSQHGRDRNEGGRGLTFCGPLTPPAQELPAREQRPRLEAGGAAVSCWYASPLNPLQGDSGSGGALKDRSRLTCEVAGDTKQPPATRGRGLLLMARPRSVQGTWSGDALHSSFQTASGATLGTFVPKSVPLDSKRPPPILRAGVALCAGQASLCPST